MRQGEGCGRAIRVDTVLAGFLGVADGTLTARVALEAIASLLDLDPATARAEALPLLRALVADGLIV